jgi:hypothetical protein
VAKKHYGSIFKRKQYLKIHARVPAQHNHLRPDMLAACLWAAGHFRVGRISCCTHISTNEFPVIAANNDLARSNKGIRYVPKLAVSNAATVMQSHRVHRLQQYQPSIYVLSAMQDV